MKNKLKIYPNVVNLTDLWRVNKSNACGICSFDGPRLDKVYFDMSDGLGLAHDTPPGHGEYVYQTFKILRCKQKIQTGYDI